MFTGIVLFISYALSNLFSPPGLLEPVALERLMRTEISAAPRPD